MGISFNCLFLTYMCICVLDITRQVALEYFKLHCKVSFLGSTIHIELFNRTRIQSCWNKRPLK